MRIPLEGKKERFLKSKQVSFVGDRVPEFSKQSKEKTSWMGGRDDSGNKKLLFHLPFARWGGGPGRNRKSWTLGSYLEGVPPGKEEKGKDVGEDSQQWKDKRKT